MNPLVDNPFFVLELGPDATPMDVERQAKKLLAMLELGLASAGTYASPLGPRPRTVDDVRQARQQLQDPAKRLAFEACAAAPKHATAVGIVDVAGVDIASALWWQP
jgi:hypothetical protein